MAMHKPKKQRRFQPGGLVTTDGKPVLDGSNKPIMTGSFPDEDEITARGRAKNAEMLKSLVNRVTGRGQDETKKVAEMDAAREKLGREAQAYVKDKGDADRLSYDAEQGAKAATSAPSRMPTRPGQDNSGRKQPTRPGQGAPKASKPVVAKTPEKDKPAAAPISRARATPAGSSPKQTMGGTYSNEGRNRPAPAAPEKRPGTALPINPSTLRQREEAEKKRDAARAAKRKAEEDEKKARPAKEAAERKALSEQPGAVAYRYKKEQEDKMSPGQRSAARGKAIKDFFGLKKGGSVSSASKRADGIAQRGKTRGKVY